MADISTITVALAGNPNAGKTSLLNAIAGTHLKVGNWPGVTVEKLEAEVVHHGRRIVFVDLPGTYSLNAYSPDEKITRNFIASRRADVVLDVAEGTNLERSLYLTVQLLELEPRTILALNMYDEVEKNGLRIDHAMLQQLLGCPVVPVSAARKSGIDELLTAIVALQAAPPAAGTGKITYSPAVERAAEPLRRLIATDPTLAAAIRPAAAAIRLLENDEQVMAQVRQSPAYPAVAQQLPALTADLARAVGSIPQRITEDRHAFARGAFRETVTENAFEKTSLTQLIDLVVLNRFLGLPIFLLVMWLIFQLTFKLGEAPMGWIEAGFGMLAENAARLLPDNWVRSVVVDGVIAGVGGVLVFLPNILLLFLGLSFLEATGYMARAAFVVDKVFHKIGLHGKSFIPMVTGFGCSVPAFMACRTLKNRGDRLATMLVIPFMSCGAKLPVHVLLIGAFFPTRLSGSLLFAVYLFGIFVAALSAKLFKSTLFRGQAEPFVMELPVYRLPTALSVLMQMWLKAWMYLKKAGTTILGASIVLWLATTYPRDHATVIAYDARMAVAENDPALSAAQRQEMTVTLRNEKASRALAYSAAGRLGRLIEPLIRPLGFDWRIGVALTAGLAAKEVVVSTMGTIYSLGAPGAETASLEQRLRADPAYNPAMALGLIVFVLLYLPCLAATVVFHREGGEWRITLFYFAYSMTAAWVWAFVVYRVGLLLV